VVFGASSGFAASLELSALDGSNGFALNGVAAEDFSGRAVAGAGDVNGDGFDDLIVGARRPTRTAISGQSYVVFGASSGFGAGGAVELSALDGGDGTDGFFTERDRRRRLGGAPSPPPATSTATAWTT
jgi:hypothetical protein